MDRGRKTWKEFYDTGLLWWVNRILHTFGWAIVFDINDAGVVIDVFPVRCTYRGFGVDSEEEGFKKVTKYLAKEVNELQKDVHE